MSRKFDHLRIKARELYESGMSLPDVCEHLNKGKGTVFYWLRGLERHATTSKKTASALAASSSNKRRAEERREAYRAEATNQLHRLATDLEFRDFVMLYLTEGTRKCKASSTVAVANSNPQLIRLATKIIRELTGKEPQFTFQYHVDQDPIQLCIYWANQVGTTPDKIQFQRKSNSGKLTGRTWASHYGVLTVRTGSVRVRTMIGVWMDELQAPW